MAATPHSSRSWVEAAADEASGNAPLWVADFCYLRCWQGLVFCAFVIDVWSRAVVEYVGWFNHDRLHEALAELPPVEFEQRVAAHAAISGNGSVATRSERAADRLYAPRHERERATHLEPALSGLPDPELASAASLT